MPFKSQIRSPRESPVPRFYIYVSDVKVDMLLAQIPRRLLKRLAAEVTVDLKVLSVKVSTRDAPETRWSRAEVVTRYLSEAQLIGELLGHEQFFAVEDLPMRWGIVGGTDGRCAFFASQDDGYRLFLSGSPHHVIGVGPPSIVQDSAIGSGIPPYDAAAHYFDSWDREAKADGDYPLGLAGIFGEGILQHARRSERLTLVARRIAEEETDGRRVIFGSPVWVAAAAPLPST